LRPGWPLRPALPEPGPPKSAFGVPRSVSPPVGLAAYDLVAAEASAPQLELLPQPGNRERRLETAMDALAERFGRGVVHRAGDLARDRGVGVAANLDFLHEQESDD
jgi:hypothetical protein